MGSGKSCFNFGVNADAAGDRQIWNVWLGGTFCSGTRIWVTRLSLSYDEYSGGVIGTWFPRYRND